MNLIRLLLFIMIFLINILSIKSKFRYQAKQFFDSLISSNKGKNSSNFKNTSNELYLESFGKTNFLNSTDLYSFEDNFLYKTIDEYEMYPYLPLLEFQILSYALEGKLNSKNCF